MTQHIRVKDVMSRDLLQLQAALSVEEAVALLQEHQLPGSPVINERKELVGFVSEHDLLCQLLQASYYSSTQRSLLDVMRTEVLSVGPEDSLVDLAQQMARIDQPKVFPVVAQQKVVGLITRSHVLGALLANRQQPSPM
ncbi:CBS domain-containing protein [Marinospirillum sp. MEB164]|uniref:CBS domain-containing protein n=1 Tax=Marinospirillum alkalitolerans TaxID=3123374 RepID=A0ABW8PU43_9GAMM